ncbi:MAG: amidohydrolase [Synergistaceae bacterium]|jgi:predicted TIM-barrel fold metal-dependent hydrolase|nr:amidohydrolase [Synergistaceae bacterium]
MVIDVHVHVFPPEMIANWERIAEREDYFSSLARSRSHRWATARDLLSAMDEDGVDESWIFGFGFNDLGLCRACNDYVLEVAASSGGHLRPLAVVPPLARGASSEIERCAALGAIGVGEIFPDGQHWLIDDIRETWRVASVCHDNGLFLLVHVAEPIGREYPGKGKIGPREAYALARNHPELKIVMSHWGGGLYMYENMKDARRTLQNVWYDVAATPFLYDSSIFENLRASALSDKILYGSDYPILRFPRYKDMTSQAALTDAENTRLLSGNAAALLHSF